MGTNPRSAGFEPRASIFRGACAAPSGKDDDIEGISIVAPMASSISSSQLHRGRRHPRRRLAYVAAVAIIDHAMQAHS